MTNSFFVGALVGIVVFALATGFFVVPEIEQTFREDAIKQGHAEYYLDAEYERQWRWLPAPSEKGTER